MYLTPSKFETSILPVVYHSILSQEVVATLRDTVHRSLNRAVDTLATYGSVEIEGGTRDSEN